MAICARCGPVVLRADPQVDPTPGLRSGRLAPPRKPSAIRVLLGPRSRGGSVGLDPPGRLADDVAVAVAIRISSSTSAAPPQRVHPSTGRRRAAGAVLPRRQGLEAQYVADDSSDWDTRRPRETGQGARCRGRSPDADGERRPRAAARDLAATP